MEVAGVRLKYFEELKYMPKMLYCYQNARVLAQHYVCKTSLSKHGDLCSPVGDHEQVICLAVFNMFLYDPKNNVKTM